VMHVFASTFVEIPSECIEKRMLRDQKKESYNNRSPTEQASNLLFCLYVLVTSMLLATI
jgi:hypothetical protein